METNNDGTAKPFDAAHGSAATGAELSDMAKILFKLDAVQLAAVAGTALGLAERKARHTVIPADHWLLKHVPPNDQAHL